MRGAIAIVLLLVCLPARAADNDHLVSAEPVIFKAAISAFSGPDVLFTGAYPVYSGLGTVVVAVTKSGGQYSLMGYSPVFGDPKTTERRCSVSLEPQLASRLAGVWKSMLLAAQPGNAIGIDGTTYFFSARDGEKNLGGKVWSPALTTNPGALTEVLDHLMRYCMGASRERSILEQETRALEEKLRHEDK